MLVQNTPFLCWVLTYTEYPPLDGNIEPEVKPDIEFPTEAPFLAGEKIETLGEVKFALDAVYMHRAANNLENPDVRRTPADWPSTSTCSAET